MKRIGRYNVRLVFHGDKFGLNDCITHEGAPMLEFYDATQDPAKFGERGQFVSRYNVATLIDDRDRLTTYGLDLHGGVAVWKMAAPQVGETFAWMDKQFEEIAVSGKKAKTLKDIKKQYESKSDPVSQKKAAAVRELIQWRGENAEFTAKDAAFILDKSK